MSDLTYSQEAEDVLNLFYQADYMVYVEGDDDICFWEVVLSKTSNLKFEIQEVGGCEELIPYIDMVKNNEANIIVACDSDLKFFGNEPINIKNIIRTYGYSIENTFVTEKTILRAIKTLGKISARDISNVDYMAWLVDFNHKVLRLICLDVYNFINGNGISIVGDNADRFMKSKTSCELCEVKINDFINSLPQDFIDFETENINALIQQDMAPLQFWIRGHFFYSASFRYLSTYLKSIGKKASVSNESLYSNLMNSFETLFNENHEHYAHYKNQVDLVH